MVSIYLHFNFSDAFRKRRFYFCKRDVSALQGHPRSLMLVPIESAFLLHVVRRPNSNLGPILHRFGDFCSFYVLLTHPYSTLILGVFPLHQIAHVGVSEVVWPWKYFWFEVFQTVWKTYLNVRDVWTDRRTTCNLITALCIASRGNKTDIGKT